MNEDEICFTLFGDEEFMCSRCDVQFVISDELLLDWVRGSVCAACVERERGQASVSLTAPPSASSGMWWRTSVGG